MLQSSQEGKQRQGQVSLAQKTPGLSQSRQHTRAVGSSGGWGWARRSSQMAWWGFYLCLSHMGLFQQHMVQSLCVCSCWSWGGWGNVPRASVSDRRNEMEHSHYRTWVQHELSTIIRSIIGTIISQCQDSNSLLRARLSHNFKSSLTSSFKVSWSEHFKAKIVIAYIYQILTLHPTSKYN